MTKPCDTEYAAQLPCCNDADWQCYGPIYFEHRPFRDKERKELQRNQMAECPWIEQVREWWRKYGRRK